MQNTPNHFEAEFTRARMMAKQVEKEARERADRSASIEASKKEIEILVDEILLNRFTALFNQHMPPVLEQLAVNFHPSDPAIAQIDRSGIAFFGPIDDIGGGGSSEPTSYAFQISAERVVENGVLSDPPTFNVVVLGGTAQVLGGGEVTFADTIQYNVANGTYVYIRYQVWDIDGNAVNGWDAEIQFGSSVPYEPMAPKGLVFALGRVGTDYVGNVNQFRVGSIQSVAVINASPSANDIEQIDIL